MYLTLDIGNTLQKAAVFSAKCEMQHLVERKILQPDEIEELFQRFHIEHSIISNVGKPHIEIEKIIRERSSLLPFSHRTPLPIQIDYEKPQTLGLDRIADAVAAHAAFPDRNVLSIQAGSCLVMDFVTKEGIFKGGSIAPGVDMRFAALHHFTRRLPIVERESVDFLTGHSTRESIESGVMNGIIDEIDGAIERYRHRYGEIQVVLTGGNKNDLEKSIKNTIFATSNFILNGLCKVLIFNVEKGKN